MRWQRQEYLDLMTFQDCPRQMFVELFGPLIGLEQEWREQGAGPDECDLSAFGFDYIPVVDCGGYTELLNPRKPQIIEETAEYIIELDAYGRKTKLFKQRATIALPLTYPVQDPDSWLKIKPAFTYSHKRISEQAIAAAGKARENGALVTASIPGGFDLPRQLMGEEGACLCYYDQPELMHDILKTVGDMALQVLDRVSEQVQIDCLCVHEDMAGKSGSLIGPEQISTFIQPYYRKIWNCLQAKGTRLFSQDSDGNMNSVIDAFLDCGINVMYPLEPAAGMDMVALRKKYGRRLAFKGGLDKHVLRQNKAAIDRELHYKTQALMQQGGVVFALDHRIPNGTPLENYRYYVKKTRELLQLPAQSERHWQRMAF